MMRDRNRPTPPSLLDRLLEDVVRSILSNSYGNLPPVALVEFACTCKAAAALTLPIMYSSILVPSLAAIARLHSVLNAKPELAQHVRSLTVSEYFADPGQFHLVSDALGELSKSNPGSVIASVKDAQDHCGPELLNVLPMAWFIRIARICPKLVSIDMSRLPDFGPATACLTFGFLELARILRDRRGRFASSNKTPLSAVHVLGGDGKPKMAFVTAIDWSRQQFDVGYISPQIKPNSYAVVPFSDLTSADMIEQQQWTIRRASLAQVVYRMALPIPGLPWYCFGIRDGNIKDRDHVFSLAEANQIARPAQLSLEITHIDKARAMHESRRIDPDQQCDSIRWTLANIQQTDQAPRAHDRALAQQVATTLQALSKFAQRPWPALSRFTCSNSFFLTHDNVSATIQTMSDAMPNLEHLELLNIFIPLDLTLAHLDLFLRRLPDRGAPLQSLKLSTFCFSNNNQVMTSPSFSAPGSGATLDAARTPLSSTQANRYHLRTLALEISGPGAEKLLQNAAPTVSVHPGLLHGIRHLTLKSVKLFVMPSQLVHAIAPSFLPLSAFANQPSVTQRTPITLEHVVLPNLKRLDVSTHSLVQLAMHQRFTSAPYRLPYNLPHAPNLEHLKVVSASSTQPLVATHILPTLLKFPKLVYARFACTALLSKDLQALVRTVLSPHPLVSPCPRLRNLILDNVADNIDGWPIVCGQLISMPHLAHLASTCTPEGELPVVFTKTTVEKGGQAVYRGPDVQATKKCDACGLRIIDVMDDEEEWTGPGGRMSMEDMMREMTRISQGRTPSANLCPVCGPREAVHVWADRVVGLDEVEDEIEGAEGLGPSLWCRDAFHPMGGGE